MTSSAIPMISTPIIPPLIAPGCIMIELTGEALREHPYGRQRRLGQGCETEILLQMH
jgi:hypothetical protein